MILICPEMEQWLMNDAIAVHLNPLDFGLPKDLKGFTELSKLQNIDKNLGFHRFVKALLNQQAPSIITLKNWIELFKCNKLDDLK